MLKVYSASAGSGKTYRLAKEYITRLFRSEYAYRHILAVTFTNKATEEMKSRILKKLYSLAVSKETPEYCEDVASANGLSVPQMTLRAKDILRRMLNDYGAFSVSTIDRFFQRTMRAFARELGLYGSYSVDLDRKAVFFEGIDMVMDSIDGSGKDSELLAWLVDTAMESIADNKDWNVKEILKDSKMDIFSEEFRLKSAGARYGDMFSKDRISVVRRHCAEIVSSFERQASSLAAQALGIIEDASLSPEDFRGKSSSPFKALVGISSGTSYYNKGVSSLLELADAGGEEWTVRTSPRRNEIIALYGALNPVLVRLSDCYGENYSVYCTALRIRPLLFKLGVMSDIMAEVDAILKDSNKVMLDDTNQRLSEIISDDDTPFIYEKLGTVYEDFMLDEFQDTSRLQWHNFLPLVSNSVSQGNETLIVGDVKQSIYRWRSGDWRILGKEVADRFNVRYESLNDNWRSRREIVGFNNDFFTYAVERSGSRMLSAVFSDVRQGIPAKREGKAGGGHVHVRFFRNGSDEAMTQGDCVIEAVSRLHGNGYALSDIAILVRTNNDGRLIVDLLKEQGIPTVSEDCMYLGASVCVGHAVRMLRESSQAHLQGKSLYRMCEDIFSSIPEELKIPETAHIYAFLDNVNDFVATEGDDVRKFLSWWDVNGREALVPAAQTDSAVKVMTIHKSKGLDFAAVILPYFEMPLYPAGNKGNWKWLKTDSKYFGEEILVPFNLNADSEKTLFKDEYLDEVELCRVDSFNLAYVAFTRSVDELIVITKPLTKKFLTGEKGADTLISEYLYRFCVEARGEGDVFDFGEWTVKEDAPASKEAAGPVLAGFSTETSDDRLMLSYDSYDYFSDAGSRRGRGQVLHSVMSAIGSAEDIDAALLQALSQGDIADADMPAFREEISRAVASVETYGWFTGKYDVLNEIEIIEPGGRVSRPDRVLVCGKSAVVVDYKFGKPEKSHEKQVGRYMRLMAAMGYEDVKGYLWYVDDGKIIRV